MGPPNRHMYLSAEIRKCCLLNILFEGNTKFVSLFCASNHFTYRQAGPSNF